MYLFLFFMFMLGAVPLESASQLEPNVYNATSENIILFTRWDAYENSFIHDAKVLNPGWGIYNPRYANYLLLAKGNNVEDLNPFKNDAGVWYRLAGETKYISTKGKNWPSVENKKIVIIEKDVTDRSGLKAEVISRDELENYMANPKESKPAGDEVKERESEERKVTAHVSGAGAGAGSGASRYVDRKETSESSKIQIKNLARGRTLLIPKKLLPTEDKDFFYLRIQ